LNLYELAVKINLRHCSRVIQLYMQLKNPRDNVIQKEANRVLDIKYYIAAEL